VSLFRAIAALAVLVAIIFGGPANAHAHAGHVHASVPSIETARLLAPQGSSRVVTTADAEKLKAFFAAKPISLSLPITNSSTDASVTADQTHRSTDCIPGACCCQGLSSCGMAGHCCAGALPQAHTWWSGDQRQARFQMPAQGLIYPDIIFGLDRPPKA
jgi:hypothetical protein